MYWEPAQVRTKGNIAGLTDEELDDIQAKANDVLYSICQRNDSIELQQRIVVSREHRAFVLRPSNHSILLDPELVEAISYRSSSTESLHLSPDNLRETVSGIRELSESSGRLLDSLCALYWAAPSLEHSPEPSKVQVGMPPEMPPAWDRLLLDIRLRELVLTDPPPTQQKRHPPRKKSFRPRHIDFAAREAMNSDLGADGEEFILQYERDCLIEAGREDLAKRVTRISKTLGDGAGYDILSFDADGKEKCIEVKTTNGGRDAPFLITANEVEYSRTHPDKYYLYRLYRFSDAPSLYVLSGSIDISLDLTPVTYRASVRGRPL